MNIAFSGAHGVGKSTLVDMLKNRISDFRVVGNPRRVLSSKLSSFKIFDQADIISQSLSTGYLAFEFARGESLISERSIIDTFAYSVNSKIPEVEVNKLIDMYKEAIAYQDIIFYIPIEFTLESSDEFRQQVDEGYRIRIDKYIKDYMDLNGIEYYTLSGDVDTRYNTLLRILEEKEII